MNEQSKPVSWRTTLWWMATVLGLALITAALIGIEGTAGAAIAGGAVQGSIGAGLWYAWHREQPHSPSPISEYVVVAYLAAWYLTLAIAWTYAGDNWADWILILPPVAWLPLASRLIARVGWGRQLGERTMARLHRLAAVIYFLSVAFLVATLIAIIVSPVPLTAAVLHLIATRFYAQRFTRVPSEALPSD